MLSYARLTAITLISLTSAHAQAQSSAFPFWEQCSFKCKAIPPIDESLISKGQKAEPIPDEVQRQTSHFLVDQSEELSTNPIHKMIVWNIYKMSKVNWERDYTHYSKGADFVLVQEAVIGTQYDEIFNRVNHWDMAVSFYQKDDSQTGVMTGSTFKSIESEAHRTEHREPFAKTPKMTLSSTYQLPSGNSLLVLNIHAINFRRLKGLRAQMEQVEHLLRGHNGPIIFAGDFNSKTKKRRRYLDKFFAQFGMIKIEWEHDDRRSFYNLDHIYHRGINIVSAEMLDELDSSDHPMLTLEFTDI